MWDNEARSGDGPMRELNFSGHEDPGAETLAKTIVALAKLATQGESNPVRLQPRAIEALSAQRRTRRAPRASAPLAMRRRLRKIEGLLEAQFFVRGAVFVSHGEPFLPHPVMPNTRHSVWFEACRYYFLRCGNSFLETHIMGSRSICFKIGDCFRERAIDLRPSGI
jgi:hypothetical protein